MLNNINAMKAFIAGTIGFIGLSFCSPQSYALSSPYEGTAHQQIVCLADNIYWEARNQPVKGMFAVAFVVDNRVSDDRFLILIVKSYNKVLLDHHGKIKLSTFQ